MIIVIVGPTAVGKTKLSIELAKKYNLCNSSITYYCFKVNNFLKTDKSVKKLKFIFNVLENCLDLCLIY